MNKYRDIIGRLNYSLFLVVVALLPFPQLLLRYACVLWIITWFLEGRWLNKPTIQSPISNFKISIPFLLFGAWYAWKAVSGLWSPDLAAWRWQMERYLTFALIIPISIWGVNEHYKVRQIGKVLVFSCVAAVPLYLGWMTWLYHHPEWVYYIPLEEEWKSQPTWWTFLSENISHFKHRLFLCSVELAGVVSAFYLYRKQLKILIPTVAIMLSAIPLTGSRQSIITAIALLSLLILFAIPKASHRWIYGIGVVAIGVLLGIGLLKYHPRMQEFKLRDITEMRQMSYDHDIRFNIWGAALQHPEDYFAYGLGAGQSKQYMAERYADAKFDYYALRQYHSHNQYLEELMEIGIGGLLLFLLAWISIPICAQKKGQQTAILFTSLFMLNMLTDCMFGRFCGIALWAVGLIVILLQSDAKRDKQTAGNTETH